MKFGSWTYDGFQVNTTKRVGTLPTVNAYYVTLFRISLGPKHKFTVETEIRDD